MSATQSPWNKLFASVKIWKFHENIKFDAFRHQIICFSWIFDGLQTIWFSRTFVNITVRKSVSALTVHTAIKPITIVHATIRVVVTTSILIKKTLFSLRKLLLTYNFALNLLSWHFKIFTDHVPASYLQPSLPRIFQQEILEHQPIFQNRQNWKFHSKH